MKTKITANDLSTEEKIAVVSGTDFMYTNPLPMVGVRSACMADGPHGLRKQVGKGDNGVSESLPSTAFPTAACSANGWNEENLFKIGRAIGEECRHYGVNILLGPAINIKRNPLCGRNFEYFSEDPLLAGKMAAAQIKGVQSTGTGATVKHFALNNSENFRFVGDSVCDARAMREIYLKPFEIAVKEGSPHAVMCAYNKINGTFCSENKWLLSHVLRDEWGYDGVVMTDWGATHDRVKALNAGLDLEMPGDTAICRKQISDGLKNGDLDELTLDRSADRILSLVGKYEGSDQIIADFDAHDRLAAEIAADCAVLMKNEGLLPLQKTAKICVLGDLFKKMRYQGAGSSMINATKVTTPRDAFDKRGIAYTYARGYAENIIEAQPELIEEALLAAEGSDLLLVFAGLTDWVESEGCDREVMYLPDNQLALIDAAATTGKPVCVVLFGGSVVELPFADKVAAILNMYLPGQSGGNAVADLLFGDKAPGGRLSETWPVRYEDVPYGNEYGRTPTEVYRESVFVGYRYYLSADKQVRFPFGYGLSYADFTWNDCAIEDKGEQISISCTVKNVGSVKSADVVQLYVKAPKTQVFKPLRELRAFKKVYLEPGEEKRVTLFVNKKDLAFYDLKTNDWTVEDGVYTFELCSDCQAVRLSADLYIKGTYATVQCDDLVLAAYSDIGNASITDEIFEGMSGLKIPAPASIMPITVESKFSDLNKTFMGRILYKAVLGIARKQRRRARRMPDGPARDNTLKGALFLQRIFESNSLISMSMSAGRQFPFNFAVAFAHLANGKIISGIISLCKRIKAPKLPKS